MVIFGFIGRYLCLQIFFNYKHRSAILFASCGNVITCFGERANWFWHHISADYNATVLSVGRCLENITFL